LYWCGATPPLAAAVKVTAVPGACGAVLSAAIVTLSTGAAGDGTGWMNSYAGASI
jgi:hypothetical protein